MKKYLIYTAILVVGLLLGWLLFGKSDSKDMEHHHDEITETTEMWTCSMHPQIMKSEPGDCPICGMELIPAEVGADGLTAEQFQLTKNAMALANIQTMVIGNTANTAGSGMTLSGKITENEDATATQPAHFNGRIEKLYVTSLGQQVKKGQMVAQVYSPDLVAAQQELITAYQNKETQPKLYEAVRNKFKNWMIHGPQLDEVETTGQVKTQFPIYSHVSGIVSEIAVNVGAHIMTGSPIFKVANLHTVWANFDVYENQIGQLKKGQELSITTKAYPNKTFTAKISFIDPLLDTDTRTVTARAVLDNKKAFFKPGMFIEGTVQDHPATTDKGIIIPASSVLWTGKRSIVYLKANPNEPVFELREITLGKQLGDTYQVLEGLAKGDEIVTNGTFTVDAAAQLQGKPSMMDNKQNKPVSLSTTNFGVRGNCELCKTTIEKAVNTVEGVFNANWDVDRKNIAVSFESTKTDVMAIHNAIAAVGYDTDKITANEKAYQNLPSCCQYDRNMTMNQSAEMELDNPTKSH